MLNAPPDAGPLHMATWESWRGWWPTWGLWFTVKRQTLRQVIHAPEPFEDEGGRGVHGAAALRIRYWNWQLTLHLGPYLWRWWHFVEATPTVKDFRP